MFPRRFCFLFAALLLLSSLPPACADDGSIDLRFTVAEGASDDIYDAALLPDGGLFICGHFTSYAGKERWRLARLRADGSLDERFDPGDSTGSAPVSRVAALPDGNLLIAGSFDRYNGRRRHLLARLKPDGAPDLAFDASRALSGNAGAVHALVVQPDGKILVGGRFDSPAFKGRVRALVRLLPDGGLDEGFGAPLAVGGEGERVNAVLPLPDGKLLVGGSFTLPGESRPRRLVRLEADGRVDGGFLAPAGSGEAVTALALQPDGKILAAGGGLDSRANRLLARLLPDGKADASFDAGEDSLAGADGLLAQALVVQPDGKVLVGGSFHAFGGMRREGLARLNADGSVDQSFVPGSGVGVAAFDDPDETPVALVRVLLPLPDGRLLIAGRFDSFNNAPYHNIARLFNTAALPKQP